MKQIYHNYTKWEDYKNGMWRKETKEYEEENLQTAIDFIGDWNKYGRAMLRVINEWPISCQHNLTDKGQNRKAWIGQAAVCIELGIPEYLTRSAWHFLTEEQQSKANFRAEQAIEKWELSQQTKDYAQTEIRF